MATLITVIGASAAAAAPATTASGVSTGVRVASSADGSTGTSNGGSASYPIPPPPPPPPPPGQPAPQGVITSFMRWTFFFTPHYTEVLSMVAAGVSRQASVLVTCHGTGCPFARRIRTAAAPTKGCRAKGKAKAKRKCPVPGTVNLTPTFGRHHLGVGTQITVAIVRAGWIGKFYKFTIRSGAGPRVGISCLALGRTRPGGSC